MERFETDSLALMPGQRVRAGVLSLHVLCASTWERCTASRDAQFWLRDGPSPPVSLPAAMVTPLVAELNASINHHPVTA